MGKNTSYSLNEKMHQMKFQFSSSMPQHTKTPTFLKETILNPKSYIDHHTLKMENFHTSLSSMNRSPRKKKKKLNIEILEPMDIMTQMNQTFIYRTCH